MSFDLQFWGTRASYPFFTPAHAGLGGDTSCVGLSVAGSRLFIDAGTGLMHAEPGDGHDIIVLSHFHLDHVLGLPYFLGKKQRGTLSLASAHCASATDLRERIGSIYGGLGFPVSLGQIAPLLEFVHIPAAGIVIGPWTIATARLNHPGDAFGYRITPAAQRDAVVYLSDHEHGSPRDAELLEFASDARLIVWDSSYDDRSFEPVRGWGHSTWQQGIAFFERTHSRALALSHHDPARTDAVADEIRRQIAHPRVFLAADRMRLNPADQDHRTR
jgi:phosphoribosyl 1,2-cyclic phosphodiesterase